MFSQSAQQTLFVAFAFISQALLIFNFAAYKWKPDIQKKWGWIVYAFGWLALPLGLFFMASGGPWYSWLACGLFGAWAIFGYVVDILRPINWRSPIRWQIFAPYLALYISAQFAFWIPLWLIWPGYWMIYAVLYTICTVLNISNHSRPGKAVSP
jgi:hypothetical protein